MSKHRIRVEGECSDCKGPLIWDSRWQGAACHFCAKLFEDRCLDLGAIDTDDVKHAIEDQSRLKEVAVQLLAAEQQVADLRAGIQKVVEEVDKILSGQPAYIGVTFVFAPSVEQVTRWRDRLAALGGQP